jgi:hypothetical protein
MTGTFSKWPAGFLSISCLHAGDTLANGATNPSYFTPLLAAGYVSIGNHNGIHSSVNGDGRGPKLWRALQCSHATLATGTGGRVHDIQRPEAALLNDAIATYSL